jgi:succinate dehydrogenase / fumarate reductase, cytochrome b subunit
MYFLCACSSILVTNEKLQTHSDLHMSWFTKFLSSSIGQKWIMSLTGIFLMLFLVVHLIGNFQLLKDDGGDAFNAYAYFMTHFPLIKIVSYGLYFFILLHAYKGIALWLSNRKARGLQRYAVQYSRPSERQSRNMAWLGIIIFIFLLIHLYQFWLQMKMGALELVDVTAYDFQVYNLYAPVKEAYSQLGYVIFYVVCMLIVGLHLWHGFWSSFQTLGISHRRYNGLIKTIGYIYSVGISLGFAIIPVYFYLFIKQ